MFTISKRVSLKYLVATAAVSLLAVLPTLANPSAQDITKMLADGSQMEVTSLKHAVIVTVSVDSTVSQDWMRDKATSYARKLQGQAEELEVLFKDKTNNSNLKEIAFDQNEMLALNDTPQMGFIQILPSDQSSINTVEKGAKKAETIVSAQSSAKAPCNQAQYQAERVKIAAQMKDLESKGVGITPFVTELKRLDGLYTHAQLAEATQGLTKLGSNLQDVENRRKEAQTTSAQLTQVRGSHTTAAHVAQSGNQDLLAASVAAYNGSVDGFVDQLVNDIARREVGRFLPNKGPFLVERFRIAKRLHELEQQRVRVDGMAQLYQQMEELVATKDSRKMSEISMNVRYLQQQLGLTQLEGTLHRSLSL